jgi:hypothetical protein
MPASMIATALGIALVSVLLVRWITAPLRHLTDASDGIGRVRQSAGPDGVVEAVIGPALAKHAQGPSIASKAPGGCRRSHHVALEDANA